MDNDISVKHVIEVTPDTLEKLFLIPATACLAVYETAELQDAALIAARTEFKTELECILNKAFCIGESMGEAKAKR